MIVTVTVTAGVAVAGLGSAFFSFSYFSIPQSPIPPDSLFKWRIIQVTRQQQQRRRRQCLRRRRRHPFILSIVLQSSSVRSCLPTRFSPRTSLVPTQITMTPTKEEQQEQQQDPTGPLPGTAPLWSGFPLSITLTQHPQHPPLPTLLLPLLHPLHRV